MPFPDVVDLVRYWSSHPPAHDLLAIAVRCFTTWEPEREGDAADATAAHRASLERRWAQGALNVKQLFELGAGVLRAPGIVG